MQVIQLQNTHSLLCSRPTSSSYSQSSPQCRDRHSYTSSAVPSTSGRRVICSAATAVTDKTTRKASAAVRGIKDNSTELIGDTPMVAELTTLRADSSLALLCTALPTCGICGVGLSEQGQREVFRPDSVQIRAHGALHEVNTLRMLSAVSCSLSVLPLPVQFSTRPDFAVCAV